MDASNNMGPASAGATAAPGVTAAPGATATEGTRARAGKPEQQIIHQEHGRMLK